jgi:hypothetical protein
MYKQKQHNTKAPSTLLINLNSDSNPQLPKVMSVRINDDLHIILKDHFKKGHPPNSAQSDTPQNDKLTTNYQSDTRFQLFRDKCEDFVLEKGKTIKPETLYEIMKDIGGFKGTIDQFMGSKELSIARTYASRLGYKRNGSPEYNK